MKSRSKPKAAAHPKRSVVVGGKQYLTLREYAEWKRVSYWTVLRAKRRGEIQVERIGKSDRVPVLVTDAISKAA